jgi:hypothetical protein
MFACMQCHLMCCAQSHPCLPPTDCACAAGAQCGWEQLRDHPTAAKYGGLPACADASVNLANPAHVDVNDAHRSFAVWVRFMPHFGRVHGHYFLFPHVRLAIEIVDGLCVSWEGRECAHCTSAPTQPVRDGDGLGSLFFSLPSDVLRAEGRIAEMRAALRARAESDASVYPAWEVGGSVWGKWYPAMGDIHTDRWYRATGTVSHVGDGVVHVDWLREAGRGRSVSELTLAQANQMLVHAGRVTPYSQGGRSGARLVGRKVSVYWGRTDVLYVADVRTYDEESGEHEVVYEHGVVRWEALDSACTYNVL